MGGLSNAVIQDLSRLGDYDNLILEMTGSETEISVPKLNSRTLLSVGSADGVDALDASNDAEALWFGTATIKMTTLTTAYTQIESSISTDVTLTTSLGTSPS